MTRPKPALVKPQRLEVSTRRLEVLARLTPEEGADVLHFLLERHPEIVAEAEEIASAMLTDVDAEAVAEDVEQAARVMGI